jgi:hypothetical protein
MTKIITCAELRHRRLEELQALFRSLEIELLAIGGPLTQLFAKTVAFEMTMDRLAFPRNPRT